MLERSFFDEQIRKLVSGQLGIRIGSREDHVLRRARVRPLMEQCHVQVRPGRSGTTDSPRVPGTKWNMEPQKMIKELKDEEVKNVENVENVEIYHMI